MIREARISLLRALLVIGYLAVALWWAERNFRVLDAFETSLEDYRSGINWNYIVGGCFLFMLAVCEGCYQLTRIGRHEVTSIGELLYSAFAVLFIVTLLKMVIGFLALHVEHDFLTYANYVWSSAWTQIIPFALFSLVLVCRLSSCRCVTFSVYDVPAIVLTTVVCLSALYQEYFIPTLL